MRRISGLLSSSRTAHSATNMARRSAARRRIHSANEIRSPVASSISPRPIRFGRAADRGEQAADARAVGEHQHQRDPDAELERIEALAAVLVLDDVRDRAEDRDRGRQQHRDRRGVGDERRQHACDRPEGDDRAVVLLPTPGIASTRKAKRRATPWLSIAWAMMNAPMKTRIVVEPNGATTSSAGATPITTIRAIPSRPPIGIGIASEIHSTITNSRAAASFCCVSSMSSGSR